MTDAGQRVVGGADQRIAGEPGPRLVHQAGRLRGTLRLPSDKSIAHRALIANALANGEATVELRWPGADVLATADALGRLGVSIDLGGGLAGQTTATIRGLGDAAGNGVARGPGIVPAAFAEVDCRNSGTSMRLLTGMAAGQPARVRLSGDASLARRPMERVAGPLRHMGAQIDTTDGHAPIEVRGRRPLRALDHMLPVASAQVLGAICLAALAAEGTTTVTTPGPTRDHTERLLSWMGAPIIRRDGVTSISGPSGLRARSLEVPGDPSSAAFWLVAAALHPDADLTLAGICLNPTRTEFLQVLSEMGVSLDIVASATDEGPEPTGSIRVRSSAPLHAISLSGERVAGLIDELPVLAIAMAAAEGRSELRDAGELRVKESDRIALMVRNLAAIGAEVEETRDGWRLGRGRPRDAAIITEGDHRIAMAFAVAALCGVAGAVEIDDPTCVGVSYAPFWDDLEMVTAAEHEPVPA